MRGGARAHASIDRTALVERRDALRTPVDGGLFALEEPMLFLVDGNNLLWRAAHGPPAPFAADDGRDLTALFRFFTLLRRALGSYGLFAECVVCFDGADAWSSRLDVDPAYKSNRDYERRDLSFMGWLPEIRAALDACTIEHVEIATSEADDVIATIAAQTPGRAVRILSTDRDYYQLIDEHTSVVSPRERPPLVTAEVIEARYGVTPDRWRDLRTLAGDPSDGIPGIRGVGMKKAAAMLAGGLSIDDLKDLITEQGADLWADVCRWRELITLRTDVDVPLCLRGVATPRLPSPSALCAGLGLVGARDA
jgi:DNA polymerase-1